MSASFDTPQDAEDAFYDAFEAHALEAMMAVWDDAEDLVCIQPMGPMLEGREAIGESWRQVFAHPTRPEITIHHRQWYGNRLLATHVVLEQLSMPGAPQEMPPFYATNVYRNTGDGWRMVLHQVSPPPPPEHGGLRPPPMPG